ncbi:hypothetical protein DPMN_091786 [Dreissena polymorpha]|uniref:Uncharacterized protein n=1 Tax=Dreissena polymorpha TaxID=45954 RepID=A0A9D4L2N9_DREPO|nr:hypothetical protein DPMN_091786 [Dreissena polymorpha]
MVGSVFSRDPSETRRGSVDKRSTAAMMLSMDLSFPSIVCFASVEPKERRPCTALSRPLKFNWRFP